MQFTIILSVVLTSIISASAMPGGSGLDGIPQCATTCAINGITGTTCSMTDFKCICQDKTFLNTIQTCVVGACSPDQQQQTLKVSKQLCQAVGVDFTATLPAAGAATSAASSTVAGDNFASPATATASSSKAAHSNGVPRMGISALSVMGVAGLAGVLVL